MINDLYTETTLLVIDKDYYSRNNYFIDFYRYSFVIFYNFFNKSFYLQRQRKIKKNQQRKHQLSRIKSVPSQKLFYDGLIASRQMKSTYNVAFIILLIKFINFCGFMIRLQYLY